MLNSVTINIRVLSAKPNIYLPSKGKWVSRNVKPCEENTHKKFRNRTNIQSREKWLSMKVIEDGWLNVNIAELVLFFLLASEKFRTFYHFSYSHGNNFPYISI